MELYREDSGRPKGVNKVMVAAVAAALVAVGVGIASLTMVESEKDQQTQALDGALRQGDAGFEELSRRIAAEPVETTQASTPLGVILMTAKGNLYNAGDRVVTALEVTLSVRDEKGNPVKEKAFIAVPSNGVSRLEPRQEIGVTFTIDGLRPEDDRADLRWKVTAIKVE
jgi:flagellar basal body-associated protein FliL